MTATLKRIGYLLKNFRLFKLWFLVELVIKYGRPCKSHFRRSTPLITACPQARVGQRDEL